MRPGRAHVTCSVPGELDWQDATAALEIKQKGAGSSVEIEVKGAVPNTLFTVWLRIQGGDGWNRDVNDNQGSPLTGGGATPLASGTDLDALNAISPWIDPAGASSSANSFTTDAHGEGEFEIDVDFPVIGGAYPFQATATSRPVFYGALPMQRPVLFGRFTGQGADLMG